MFIPIANVMLIKLSKHSDGCSRTPIIGTRYRATKIPDFDLCGACYKSYEGEDLDFKPETLGEHSAFVFILQPTSIC